MQPLIEVLPKGKSRMPAGARCDGFAQAIGIHWCSDLGLEQRKDSAGAAGAAGNFGTADDDGRTLGGTWPRLAIFSSPHLLWPSQKLLSPEGGNQTK